MISGCGYMTKLELTVFRGSIFYDIYVSPSSLPLMKRTFPEPDREVISPTLHIRIYDSEKSNTAYSPISEPASSEKQLPKNRFPVHGPAT